jgi:hypothetical protein
VVFMPHMRGLEPAGIFHDRTLAIALIAMSGYAFANLNSPAPDVLRMALERVALPAQIVQADRAAQGDQRNACPRAAPAGRRRHCSDARLFPRIPKMRVVAARLVNAVCAASARPRWLAGDQETS